MPSVTRLITPAAEENPPRGLSRQIKVAPIRASCGPRRRISAQPPRKSKARQGRRGLYRGRRVAVIFRAGMIKRARLTRRPGAIYHSLFPPAHIGGEKGGHYTGEPGWVTRTAGEACNL